MNQNQIWKEDLPSESCQALGSALIKGEGEERSERGREREEKGQMEEEEKKEKQKEQKENEKEKKNADLRTCIIDDKALRKNKLVCHCFLTLKCCEVMKLDSNDQNSKNIQEKKIPR